MRAYTHPPAKTGVTGVTRVTPIAKRPVSLAFTYVTQLSSLAFIRCNTARACNAKNQSMAAAGRRSCTSAYKAAFAGCPFESRAWDSPLHGTDYTSR